MPKIAVIGGSGFIGTRLCHRFFCSEKSFKILDKVPSYAFPAEAVSCDVRSLDALRAHIPEGAVLINLAAEHRDDVRPRHLYHDVNVGGAHNLCLVARERCIKTIVFTSTVAVYGFAPLGTDESGAIVPFNDYGRTKFEAEQLFRDWQAEEPTERTLVIIRPTVVFGEQNRGNVYNLLRQLVSGQFVMVGNGTNHKSTAYVENIAAFIEHSLDFKTGLHIYNYIDKPDYTMNALVARVNGLLGRPQKIRWRLPYSLGYLIGKGFDMVGAISGRRFAISALRVKKFCASSVYKSAVGETDFVPPVSLELALEKTIRYEFLEDHSRDAVFYSE